MYESIINSLLSEKYKNINLFIDADREKFYDTEGRTQTLEQANKVDKLILDFLHKHNVYYNKIAKNDIEAILKLIKE